MRRAAVAHGLVELQHTYLALELADLERHAYRRLARHDATRSDKRGAPLDSFDLLKLLPPSVGRCAADQIFFPDLSAEGDGVEVTLPGEAVHGSYRAGNTPKRPWCTD